MLLQTISFFIISALAAFFFSVKNIGHTLSKGDCYTLETSSNIDGERYDLGFTELSAPLIADDLLSVHKEVTNPLTATSIDVANSPTLTIISKEIYEDQYKSSVPAMHIIRLKSLNPTISIRSIPETKEGLSQITFPDSPSMQAYYLYSGSCLIVEINKK